MMNWKAFVLCCIATLSYTSADAADVWSLDDCIKYACEHRTDINRQRGEIEIKQIQLKQEKNRHTPTIEAKVSPAFSTGMNMDLFFEGDFLYLPAQITGNMSLIDFSSLHGKKASEYALKASDAYYQQTRQEIAIAVTSYYLQAEYAKKALSLAEDIVSIDLENLEYVSRCLSEGALPESEMTKAELALAADEKNVISAKSLRDIALLELQYFINSPDPIDVFEPTVSEYSDINFPILNFPGIAAGEFALSQSEYALKSAKAQWLPTISLTAGAGGFTYNAFTNKEAIPYYKSFWKNRNAAVCLNLNIPIIDKSRKRLNVQMQTIEVKNRQLALDETKIGFEKKISLLRNRIESEKEAAEKLETVVEKAVSNYHSEKCRYEGGLSSWFNLQEAKKQLKQSRLDAMNNHIQYLLDNKSLEIYSGQKQ